MPYLTPKKNSYLRYKATSYTSEYRYNTFPISSINKRICLNSYAIATNEKEPGVRHLFKVGDYNSTQPWTCLTCKPHVDDRTYDSSSDVMNETLRGLAMLSNYNCEYNNIIFSGSNKYYIQECLGPSVPVVFLVETATNYRVAVLSSSNQLRNDIKNFAAPQLKRISVTIEGEYIAQVRLFLPPILREYEEVTFPTILLV